MYQHTPKYCKSITLNYAIISPGSPATFHHPAEDTEIEIESVEVVGMKSPIPQELEGFLLEQHGEEWTDEILKTGLSQAKADYEADRAEYLYDQMMDRGVA